MNIMGELRRGTAEESQLARSPVRAFDTSDFSTDDDDDITDADAVAAAAATTTAGVSFYLHVIKWIALVFVALCVLVGSVMSKVTFVSIVGRMFNLSAPDEPPDEDTPRSLLFIQLTISLVIPEAISFIRCLVCGVIGKTTESYPWPSRSAFFWVSSHVSYISSFNDNCDYRLTLPKHLV